MRTRSRRKVTPSATSRRRCSRPASPGREIRPPAPTTRCHGNPLPRCNAHTVSRAAPRKPAASATAPYEITLPRGMRAIILRKSASALKRRSSLCRSNSAMVRPLCALLEGSGTDPGAETRVPFAPAPSRGVGDAGPRDSLPRPRRKAGRGIRVGARRQAPGTLNPTIAITPR
jgi:hypothetical protein